MVQGWLAVAAGGSGALPSYPSIGGSLPSGFVFADVIAPFVIAPAIEEPFFRAVVLVSVYTLLRRPVGVVMAGAVAVVASTGLFVLLHSLSGRLGVDEVISLSLLGLVCGSLVMLTGGSGRPFWCTSSTTVRSSCSRSRGRTWAEATYVSGSRSAWWRSAGCSMSGMPASIVARVAPCRAATLTR